MQGVRIMKAFGAVATAPWQVEYLPVEVPEPGAEDVVIRVTHSWISNGTEGSGVRGERLAGDPPRRKKRSDAISAYFRLPEGWHRRARWCRSYPF